MPKRYDLAGQKFGRLKVIKFHDVQHGMSRWECKCDCGTETIAYGRHMVSGNTQSCGCLGHERRLQSCTQHNDCGNSLYTKWADMKDRCTNPNNRAYKWYGGKGVKVCAEWQSYPAFKQWALESGYQPGLTIDRRDPDRDYCPENCRWLTHAENTRHAVETRSKLHWGRDLSDGTYYEFLLIKPFAVAHNLNYSALCAHLRGQHKPISGWEFGIVDQDNVA